MIEYLDEDSCFESKVTSGKKFKKIRRTNRPKKKEFYGDERFRNGDYNDAYECRRYKEDHGDIDYGEDCNPSCDVSREKGCDGLLVHFKHPKSIYNKIKDYGDAACCGGA